MGEQGSNKDVKSIFTNFNHSHSQMAQPPGNQGNGLMKLTSRLTSLTGGNFFLHSIDRDRRSVCMFSSNFFTASGLLVDIFDGVCDRNLEKLQTIRNAGARSPPTHPQQEYNPLMLHSAPMENKIKTPRSIDIVSHFSASSVRPQESSDVTGISSSSSEPVDFSFVKQHRSHLCLFLKAAH